ncbi:hypothetical protein TA3x_000256 [Tundrisphaera sp. TA3]|uniref:hypothetical protein n=1 Tax=Tundrisphaera sp. TA3 TaxID=3435775 RepID=UPI003EB938EB
MRSDFNSIDPDDAMCPVGVLARLAGGQDQGDQDGDGGDHHQLLDRREPATIEHENLGESDRGVTDRESLILRGAASPRHGRDPP